MLEILVVDDEPAIREAVAEALRDEGHNLTLASDGAQAIDLVRSRVFDVALIDVRLPHVDGMTVFRRLRAEFPSTDSILVTAHSQLTEAVEALKEGAHDYLAKPIDLDEIRLRVQRIDERRALQRELDAAREALQSQIASSTPAVTIIGRSPPMARLLQKIDAVAPSDAPVLVVGESGTGKELVARRLHGLSTRAARPFVAINCAAFPENLVEAELFGYERGAFTGALRRRDGRFKAADGGTLFLDEVAELPLATQAKLLRVLQDGSFEPLGTNSVVTVDVRVLSATHRDLRRRLLEGLFREDLYYRLKVLGLDVPPLRDRRGDLPLLVQHFLRIFTPAERETASIAPRAWATLVDYPFPGNVRELEHAIQHAAVLAGGREIDLEHLPGEFSRVATPATSGLAEVRPLFAAIREFEHEYVLRALERAGGKKARAAELLGISRKALWNKLRADSAGNGSRRAADIGTADEMGHR